VAAVIGLAHETAEDVIHHARVDGPTAMADTATYEEMPALCLDAVNEVLPDRLHCLLGQRYDSLLAALAPHQKLATLQVEITQRDSGRLGPPDARCEHQHDKGLGPGPVCRRDQLLCHLLRQTDWHRSGHLRKWEAARRVDLDVAHVPQEAEAG